MTTAFGAALSISVAILLVVGVLFGVYYGSSSANISSLTSEVSSIEAHPTTVTVSTTYSTTYTQTVTEFITSTSSSSSLSIIPSYAVINTSQGVMEVELFPSIAPETVANFISLANSGFYNNLVWHRIVNGFVIQTGDPTSRNGGGTPSSWGQTGSSTTVPLEANSTTVAEGYVNDEGYLGLARGQSLDSGSSQFYINLANNTSLNAQYTVFGKLISGLNVALAIGNLAVYSQCQASGGVQCWPLNPSQAMVYTITIKDSP